MRKLCAIDGLRRAAWHHDVFVDRKFRGAIA
jgi:hypothetical protein